MGKQTTDGSTYKPNLLHCISNLDMDRISTISTTSIYPNRLAFTSVIGISEMGSIGCSPSVNARADRILEASLV